MMKRILVTVLIYITCIWSTCLSGETNNVVHCQKCNDLKKTAAVLRDKLFAGGKYIEYESVYYFGESPFYIKIQEAYSGEFILYLRFLKEAKNVSVNEYVLKYDGKIFSTSDKDPFFDLKPQEMCNTLCLPIAYLLKNKIEKNGIIIKFIENQKTIAYACGIYANEGLFTFIQENDKMEYYGGYSGGMGYIFPLSFTRKNVYDEKSFLNSADKFNFAKDEYKKQWDQRMDMMCIWIESVESQKSVWEKLISLF